MRKKLIWFSIASTPLLILLALSLLARSLGAMGSDSPAASPLWVGPMRNGLHLYGWSYEFFGTSNSFPSNPDVDIALSASLNTKKFEAYIEALTNQKKRPPYILDRVAVGKGGILQSRFYPTIQQLDDSFGGIILNGYRLLGPVGADGLLYEKVSDRSRLRLASPRTEALITWRPAAGTAASDPLPQSFGLPATVDYRGRPFLASTWQRVGGDRYKGVVTVEGQVPADVFTVALQLLGGPGSKQSARATLICSANRQVLDSQAVQLIGLPVEQTQTVYLSAPWRLHRNCESPRLLRVELLDTGDGFGQWIGLERVTPVGRLVNAGRPKHN